MAISFVGAGIPLAISGNFSIDVTLPAMQQGDVVIVAWGVGDNDDVDADLAPTTAGYTEVADLFANDTQDCHLGVFYKFMGASPDATVTVPAQGGSNATSAVVALVFRGVGSVGGTGITGIDTMHPNPPSRATGAGIWTVIAGASSHTLGNGVTYTFPAGYTVNATQISGDTTTTDASVGLGYKTTPSDPEDPGVMTLSGADNAGFSWCAATLTITEPGGGGPLALQGRLSSNV
jgi:hypothetical protein